ncbi:MAG: protein-export chaperone SecB [bacterium]
MSETTSSPENGAMNDKNAPSMRVISQYVKDLSFENPSAPASIRPDLPKPGVNMEVNLSARPLGNDLYEVELSISATAKDKENDAVIYVVETNYGGTFEIKNIPEEHMGAVLLVDCPTLMFPFARQIVANATQNGGFQPLMLEPLNFASMYQQQIAQQQAAQTEGSTAPEVGNA